MKRYLYCYNTIVSFSEPVGNHEFLIRCQPVLGEYMNVEEEHLILPPDYWKHHGTDTFKTVSSMEATANFIGLWLM